jgi:hypothetical protein
MNFSSVRGYNAYAQFTTKIRETIKAKTVPQEQEIKQDGAYSLYIEPVDTVTISHPARNASDALLAARENTAHTEFKEWKKNAATATGMFAQSMSHNSVEKLLSKSDIRLEDGEAYNISINAWSAVSVVGKNAEKAKAIQDLLNNTPSGINWGFLLQKLPV